MAQIEVLEAPLLLVHNQAYNVGSNAQRLLNFNPCTTLAEGLRRAALWYPDNQKIDDR